MCVTSFISSRHFLILGSGSKTGGAVYNQDQLIVATSISAFDGVVDEREGGGGNGLTRTDRASPVRQQLVQTDNNDERRR